MKMKSTSYNSVGEGNCKKFWACCEILYTALKINVRSIDPIGRDSMTTSAFAQTQTGEDGFTEEQWNSSTRLLQKLQR